METTNTIAKVVGTSFIERFNRYAIEIDTPIPGIVIEDNIARKGQVYRFTSVRSIHIGATIKVTSIFYIAGEKTICGNTVERDCYVYGFRVLH